MPFLWELVSSSSIQLLYRFFSCLVQIVFSCLGPVLLKFHSFWQDLNRFGCVFCYWSMFGYSVRLNHFWFRFGIVFFLVGFDGNKSCLLSFFFLVILLCNVGFCWLGHFGGIWSYFSVRFVQFYRSWLSWIELVYVLFGTFKSLGSFLCIWSILFVFDSVFLRLFWLIFWSCVAGFINFGRIWQNLGHNASFLIIYLIVFGIFLVNSARMYSSLISSGHFNHTTWNRQLFLKGEHNTYK